MTGKSNNDIVSQVLSIMKPRFDLPNIYQEFLYDIIHSILLHLTQNTKFSVFRSSDEHSK